MGIILYRCVSLSGDASQYTDVLGPSDYSRYLCPSLHIHAQKMREVAWIRLGIWCTTLQERTLLWICGGRGFGCPLEVLFSSQTSARLDCWLTAQVCLRCPRQMYIRRRCLSRSGFNYNGWSILIVLERDLPGMYGNQFWSKKCHLSTRFGCIIWLIIDLMSQFSTKVGRFLIF